MVTNVDLWPWWLGALLLSTAATFHLWSTGKIMGVSGCWARVMEWHRERELRAAEVAMQDSAAMEAELLRLTTAQFGAEAVEAMKSAGTPDVAPTPMPPMSVRLSSTSSLIFLIMLGVGGGISAVLRGNWHVQNNLGDVFVSFFGAGWQSWLVLIAGGVCVGLGTRLAGGCTSGHGLAGCARLEPTSLVSTALFFGMGVAVSFLLQGVFG